MKHNEWLGKLQCSAVETRWKGLAARCRQEAMCRPPIQSLLHPWQSDMMFSSSKQHGRERLFDAEKNTAWRRASSDELQVQGASKGFEFSRCCMFHLWPDHHATSTHLCTFFTSSCSKTGLQDRAVRFWTQTLGILRIFPWLAVKLSPGAKSVSLLGPECPSLHILWLADSWQALGRLWH